jgi:hypothetical protein
MKSILSEEQVRAVFSSCQKECDVLIALLKIVVPNWDEVEYVLEGRPHMGAEGWHAIYDRFCQFASSMKSTRERVHFREGYGFPWAF